MNCQSPMFDHLFNILRERDRKNKKKKRSVITEGERKALSVNAE